MFLFLFHSLYLNLCSARKTLNITNIWSDLFALPPPSKAESASCLLNHMCYKVPHMESIVGIKVTALCVDITTAAIRPRRKTKLSPCVPRPDHYCMTVVKPKPTPEHPTTNIAAPTGRAGIQLERILKMSLIQSPESN